MLVKRPKISDKCSYKNWESYHDAIDKAVDEFTLNALLFGLSRGISHAGWSGGAYELRGAVFEKLGQLEHAFIDHRIAAILKDSSDEREKANAIFPKLESDA